MSDLVALRDRLRAAGARRMAAIRAREDAMSALVPLIREAVQAGLGASEIADLTGLSRQAIYDALKTDG